MRSFLTVLTGVKRSLPFVDLTRIVKSHPGEETASYWWSSKLWIAVVCVLWAAGSPCQSSRLQTEIRTCKRSMQTQISRSWVTFKPWHCLSYMHDICVDPIHRSQLATATKRPGESLRKKTCWMSKMRTAKRQRRRDNVYSEWMRKNMLGIKEGVRLEGLSGINAADADLMFGPILRTKSDPRARLLGALADSLSRQHVLEHACRLSTSLSDAWWIDSAAAAGGRSLSLLLPCHILAQMWKHS